MISFQARQRVIVSAGQHHGCRGAIQGTKEENGVCLIEVRLDGHAETKLFRAAMLMKERVE
ncbi:MAG: hypothetical protein E6Q40_08855 [Cupriavidus sp.]|nr:MAG: hypothetical protein E6Q40_08855 [Cupriavidus sp.]